MLAECDRLALLQPILGLYGQMYAAKLAAVTNDKDIKADESVSANVADEEEQAATEAVFSPEKLMAWLDNPANKARMYA